MLSCRWVDLCWVSSYHCYGDDDWTAAAAAVELSRRFSCDDANSTLSTSHHVSLTLLDSDLQPPDDVTLSIHSLDVDRDVEVNVVDDGQFLFLNNFYIYNKESLIYSSNSHFSSICLCACVGYGAVMCCWLSLYRSFAWLLNFPTYCFFSCLFFLFYILCYLSFVENKWPTVVF